MKKILVLTLGIFICSAAVAQNKRELKKAPDVAPKEELKKQLPPPFKGGIDSLIQFFKDNIVVSPQIIKAKATGTAIIKFSAEEKGMLTSIVICYADDYILTKPVTDALRRSNGKWMMPVEAKQYDYVVQFVYNYKPTGPIKPDAYKAILDFYQQRKPIVSHDQVPLMFATLLPTIEVDYQ